MKKILIALLIASLCLSFVACSAGDESGESNSSETTTDSASIDDTSSDESSDDGTSSDESSDDGTTSSDESSDDDTSSDESSADDQTETYPPAPEGIDDIGEFKEDIAPNAKEDEFNDNYEWIG